MERERVRHQELEQRLIEAKLRQQQLQSEEDSRWLRQEESNLVMIYWSAGLSLSIDCISSPEEETFHHSELRLGALRLQRETDGQPQPGGRRDGEGQVQHPRVLRGGGEALDCQGEI